MQEYDLEENEDGTHQKFLAEKERLENMLRDYVKDTEAEHVAKKKTRRLKTKNKRRDSKTEKIRMRKFADKTKNKQLSVLKKRDSQQVKMCMKIFKLAGDLEKKKLIDEKTQAKKARDKRRRKKLNQMASIESKFKNEVNIVREKIHQEKLDRKVSKYAQTQALSSWKKDMNKL